MNLKLVGIAFLCLGAFIINACGSTDRQTCEPGRQLECTCAGGATGFQKCLDDGSGWGECECACEKDCTGLVCGPDPVCGESCGTCDTGEECVSGACKCGGSGGDCASQEICCGTTCHDPMTDMNHCGSCDVSCGQNQTCENGVCVCVEGHDDCDGDSGNGCETILDEDLNNCGQCAVVCDAGESCEAGSCSCGGTGPDCAADEICCGAECFDPLTDEAHCGDCANSCDLNEECNSGSCMCGGSGPDCEAAEICCGTGCFNPSTSEEHCGDCATACEAWEDCQNGFCVMDMQCGCNYDCGERSDNYVCNRVSHQCETGTAPADPCIDDCDCYAGESCVNGSCGNCESNDDCTAPACVCESNWCTAPPPLCRNDDECCSGYHCNFGTCLPDVVTCTTDADCTRPATQCCIGNVCTDMDCGTLECGLDPVCGKECGPCVDPEVCTDGSCLGVCVADPDNQMGQPCDCDEECDPSVPFCFSDELYDSGPYYCTIPNCTAGSCPQDYVCNDYYTQADPPQPPFCQRCLGGTPRQMDEQCLCDSDCAAGAPDCFKDPNDDTTEPMCTITGCTVGQGDLCPGIHECHVTLDTVSGQATTFCRLCNPGDHTLAAGSACGCNKDCIVGAECQAESITSTNKYCVQCLGGAPRDFGETCECNSDCNDTYPLCLVSSKYCSVTGCTEDPGICPAGSHCRDLFGIISYCEKD